MGRLRSQSAEDAALADCTAFGAGMLQLFQGIFQAFKLLQTLAYMAEVPSQKGIHLTAIRVRLVGQAYELPDFVLCHIQVTATFDEQQAIKVSLPLLAISTGQAVGCRPGSSTHLTLPPLHLL